MSGQATVVIGANVWSVAVALTTAELTAGLSNIAGMSAGTGMLFDMGSDRSSIAVNMSQMLFSLDIVFISSTGGVVGVLHDVEPSEAAVFDAGNGLGARYFLEVNAGEAVGVSVGDNVQISGDVQPAFWAVLITAMMAISQIAIVGASTYRIVKEELKKSKEA